MGDNRIGMIQNIDPVVAALHAAKRDRKVYPAGHNFSMTNPIVNGQMVTLGTCACGEKFSYSWGLYEVMDAAIEAHWQKFDHQPDKVDGRGNRINAEERPRAAASDTVPTGPRKCRRTGSTPKASEMPILAPALPEPALSCVLQSLGDAGSSSKPDAGGLLASFASAPLVVAPDGADAASWSPLLRAALELAWRDESDA